ncbi:MAG: PilN domain-containing protein [Deltaproteobacteria bacterium]|nr:PilN domain-containing protein [Deltaproteobacteria bacterium]MBW1875678.1 PilN domain-containing protein [Deltaproteobacteria bacterium]MBW2209655.1 PilN domain-containing protein [Deltaproteobacteria bacterium]MBW2213327.1 PilN domain-containing protein [Deltaproteobacteria bacterium]MBW2378812.1 PilN domain-containing protein [Deltaproteobacteria bacterium]
MIRINLLPTDKKKRARRVAASPLPTGDLSLGTWGVIYGGAIAVWFVVLGILYFAQSGELEALHQENKTLEARRDELQGKTKGLADVEGRLEKSRGLEKVVQDLERARRGPTRAVMELSKVLSSPGGPTINPAELERMREENPLAGFNESWDVRRLWLTRFEEVERECKMTGMGRSNEDVAEFLRRLTLSEIYDSVTLQRTRATSDPDSGLRVVGFDITCKVRY